MDSLYLLIPIALIFVAIAIRVFFWAINSGQYDNLDTEAHRILFDDDETASASEPQQSDSHPNGSHKTGRTKRAAGKPHDD
ncbi:cbb3-type cytochrome oxidase assembly protein CcoS [uncultured Gilvimarinus sp.]|uniref:cbb3-type cytochrome oxidase assembly protein CcoS n=1 Tax=uncultured Gilvimarinus sp. TaxID=1689143 RepID=UPI0030D9DE44